ncbi:MAG: hypothetical protein JNN04_17500 [Cyclobacteriaceae bacterium]|nr:hypothetical protein [Cyclobacteriaceae bacterium]
MKNPKSKYLIVAISLLVGLLHFLIGPDYQGVFRDFMRGYLIDILLPCNLYLLLQIAIRKHTSVFLARLAGAGFTFSFGVVVEILQAYHVQFLGTTYDPLDILMYAIGVGLGILLDLTLLDRLEKSSPEDHQSAGK